MSKTKCPAQCYYCTINEAEERCIYCTRCRLLMAEGKIVPNFMKGKICLSCEASIGPNPMSNVICDKCIKEL